MEDVQLMEHAQLEKNAMNSNSVSMGSLHLKVDIVVPVSLVLLVSIAMKTQCVSMESLHLKVENVPQMDHVLQVSIAMSSNSVLLELILMMFLSVS